MATALSADSDRRFRNQGNPAIYDDVITTAVEVFRGSLAVVVAATGRTSKHTVNPAGMATLCKGVWLENATGNVGGTERARLQSNVEALFNVTLITQGHVGRTVYALNDNTVTTLTNSGSVAAKRIGVGKLVARDETETTKWWIAIGSIGIANAIA